MKNDASPTTTTELILQIPGDHACYADHFPGNPLVPGALLVKWINELLEREFSCKIVRLKNIKFLAPVKPGDQLKIIVGTSEPVTQLSFSTYMIDTLVIKGSVECFSIEKPNG